VKAISGSNVFWLQRKKIQFYTHPAVGKENKPTSGKYIMLSYFLSDLSDIETIERTIAEIELVQSNQKTLDEVFTNSYGIISIGVNAGRFVCDKDTAYLTNNNPDLEQV
jgi:hypothetical protein